MENVCINYKKTNFLIVTPFYFLFLTVTYKTNLHHGEAGQL
jgi:hypothetical protein